MSLKIPAPDLMRYRAAARERWQRERTQRAERQERAWSLAHQAADLLRTRFGVERVSVFGSLAHEGRFALWSDVDLAAWGLTATNWLAASAAVRALARDIELNLVGVSGCSPELLVAIERDGVAL